MDERRLAEDLARLVSEAHSGPTVPEEIDASLRAAFAAHFAEPGFGRRRRRWPMVAGTLAAAVIVVITLLVVGPGRRGAGPAGDFDRDGRADIVDAYRLALLIEGGEAVDGRFDLDGDGVVDSRDVRLIAARAVSIGEEAGS